MAGLRWLLVAENGWGLGHVSRQLGVARALRRLRPDDEFLFLTHSEACHLIWREGFSSLKLPCLEQSRPERLLSRDTLWWVTSASVHACATSYRPHVIVVDTFPAGGVGQLAQLLSIPARRVLIARENRFMRNPASAAALASYHLAVAPYQENEVDIQLPPSLPLHWVGPILVRSREDALNREEARARLGLPAHGLTCLITFGGGGNPRYLEAERWALSVTGNDSRWSFAVATPPLLEAPAQVSTLPQSACAVSYYPLSECFAAFDLVISGTGSTVIELQHFRVPAILVSGTHDLKGEDYAAKAQRFAGEAAGRIVRMGDDGGLRAALEHFSDPAARTAAVGELETRFSPDGAASAARIMVDALRVPGS
jgi:predicted glycosyltransferase